MNRDFRKLCWAALAWAVAALAIFTFYHELLWVLPIAILLYFSIFLVGICLVGYSVAGAITTMARWRFLALASCVILAEVALWKYGAMAGHHVRFTIRSAQYQAVVDEWKSKAAVADADRKMIYRSKYQVQIGPPMRVGFHLPTGSLDRALFIYDESGELASLAEIGPALRLESRDLRIRGLQGFGGTIDYCQRLRENWYYCSFH